MVLNGLIWLDGLILLLTLLGAVLLLYARAGRRARLRARAIMEARRRNGQAAAPRGERELADHALALLRRLGSMLPLLNAAQRSETAVKLVAAGYRSPQALLILMALTLLSSLGCVLLCIWLAGAYIKGQGPVIWMVGLAGAAYIGSLIPRIVLDRLVRRRQEAIRLSLPDALDLLVICTNAGLALNTALERVASELETVAPALADELKLTASELKIGSDIEAVLGRLAERTGIDGMRTLVNTFLQARQYGTAITQALRVLAKSERTARLMRLEESAAKLAVKMTVPMMLFILPTVLIVGAGPAVLSLIKYFSAQ